METTSNKACWQTELDWASPTSGTRVLAKKHGVRAELVTSNGPGGWPVYRFVGKREALKALVDEYCDVDDAEDCYGIKITPCP